MQHVRLGARQYEPSSPHSTAPPAIKLTGTVGSALGPSMTTFGLPSLLLPVPLPLAPCEPELPAAPGAPEPSLPLAPVAVSPFVESPQAAMTAAENVSPSAVRAK